MNTKRGFTLTEILVTLAIFVLMAGIGLFMSFEAYRGATRRSERDTIVSLLEKARSRAMANTDQSEWSVCYDAGDYIIAKGATCDDSTAYDRIEANAGVVAASDFSDFESPNEIIFAQLTGNVVAAPYTIEVVQEGNPPEEITINYEGRINW